MTSKLLLNIPANTLVVGHTYPITVSLLGRTQSVVLTPIEEEVLAKSFSKFFLLCLEIIFSQWREQSSRG